MLCWLLTILGCWVCATFVGGCGRFVCLIRWEVWLLQLLVVD